jgi:Tfp pilus assembly protein FimT
VTLFELLLCVGLISLIAALAMPFFSSADGAREAKDRRNAQTFCSMFAVVQAAGVSMPTEGEGDAKLQIMTALRQGITVEKGALRGRTFQVSNLADEEMAAASRFLLLQDGQLVYDPNEQDG